MARKFLINEDDIIDNSEEEIKEQKKVSKPAQKKTPVKEKKNVSDEKAYKQQAQAKAVSEEETQEEKATVPKETVNKRKKKTGGKQLCFWLDEDLVEGLFGSLKYGETYCEKLNMIIREYQKSHK